MLMFNSQLSRSNLDQLYSFQKRSQQKHIILLVRIIVFFDQVWFIIALFACNFCFLLFFFVFLRFLTFI